MLSKEKRPPVCRRRPKDSAHFVEPLQTDAERDTLPADDLQALVEIP